jgi:hypothetical protein
MIALMDQAQARSARRAARSAAASSCAPVCISSANCSSRQKDKQIEGCKKRYHHAHRQRSEHDGSARTARNDLGDANILWIVGPDGVRQRPFRRHYVKWFGHCDRSVKVDFATTLLELER